jgi:hypothetical protein
MGLGGWERLAGVQRTLITNTGRTSGKCRETMVDIMEHDPSCNSNGEMK